MSLAIGPITINATDTQNQRMRPFIETAVALLGLRLQPLSVEVRARASMPMYRDPRPGDSPTDGHAEGFWRGTARKILIADDVLPRADLEETVGHELIHVLFDDWFNRAQRRTLLSYLDPVPENYSDTMVNGRDRGYPALPEECIAVWGSAALFGFAKPAYASLYRRTIADVLYPAVKATMLGVEPVPPAPAPVPPDPIVLELQGQVTDLTAKIESAKAVLS